MLQLIDKRSDSKDFNHAINLLNEYTKIEQAIDELRDEHAELFSLYEELLERKKELETVLKHYARKLGRGFKNNFFSVSVLRKKRRYFRADIILKEQPQLSQIPGLFSVERDYLIRLSNEGQVDEEILKKAYREEDLTSSVTIKRLGNES